MKICIATMKGGLDDEVSPVFGRCMKFTLCEYADGENVKTAIVDNPGFTSPGGAGIKAAQYVVNEKVDLLISGNFGPNAVNVLNAGDVKMVQASGNVKENIQRYLSGELKPVSKSTVVDHFGMNQGGPGRHGHGRRGGLD